MFGRCWHVRIQRGGGGLGPPTPEICQRWGLVWMFDGQEGRPKVVFILLHILKFFARQPYFSIEPISLTGYSLRVCHGWFHLQGLPCYIERSGTRVERELQNEKFLITVGFEPRAFRLQSEGATTEQRRTDVCRVNKRVPGFNCAIFRN